MRDFRKITFDDDYRNKRKETVTIDQLKSLQVMVYVMCGGGWIGQSAAQQPAGFYIDTRTSTKPYKNKEIMQAVQVLKIDAELLGLDPNHLPSIPNFHNCGIF